MMASSGVAMWAMFYYSVGQVSDMDPCSECTITKIYFDKNGEVSSEFSGLTLVDNCGSNDFSRGLISVKGTEGVRTFFCKYDAGCSEFGICEYKMANVKYNNEIINLFYLYGVRYSTPLWWVFIQVIGTILCVILFGGSIAILSLQFCPDKNNSSQNQVVEFSVSIET